MAKKTFRPLIEKTPETIARIIAAGRKIFAERGLGATTIEELANEAQLSKPIIYYYFEGKEDVHTKVIMQIVEESHSIIFDIDFEKMVPLEGIRKVFEVSFDWNRGSSGKFAIDEMLLEGKFIKEGDAVQQCGTKVTAILARLIERGQADGSIITDADPLAVHIQAWLLNVGFLSSRKLLEKYLASPLSGPDEEMAWRRTAANNLVNAIAAKTKS